MANPSQPSGTYDDPKGTYLAFFSINVRHMYIWARFWEKFLVYRSRYKFQTTKGETQPNAPLSLESFPASNNGAATRWCRRDLEGIRSKRCLDEEGKICVQHFNYYVDITSRNQPDCKPWEAGGEISEHIARALLTSTQIPLRLRIHKLFIISERVSSREDHQTRRTGVSDMYVPATKWRSTWRGGEMSDCHSISSQNLKILLGYEAP